MSQISEKTVKETFLGYLREFYLYRYEFVPELSRSSYDNVTQEGIVADGLLHFRKSDGTEFTCTFEATSLDKADEVKFRLNLNYFIWDCIAFSLFVSAVVMAVMLIVKADFLRHVTPAGKLGLPLGVSVIAFFVWYFIMRNWSKYRYVFAVEQFKSYHADEQWIAIAEDVFPLPTDPYWVELKEQCIYHGFGLAVVYADRSVRVVSTPSRLGMLGANREMAHWLTHSELFQTVSKGVYAATHFGPPAPGPLAQALKAISRPFNQYILKPIRQALGQSVGQTEAVYDRYMAAQSVQKWVAGFSLLALTLISYQIWNLTASDFEDAEEVAVEEPEKPRKRGNPEETDQIMLSDDESPIPFGTKSDAGQYGGIAKQAPVPADYKNSPLPASQPAAAKEKLPVAIDSTASKPKKVVPKTAPSPQPAVKRSPCETLKHTGGWYIQDNRFSQIANARDRAALLRKAGVTCEVLETSCLGESGYIVRLGDVYSKEESARAKAEIFRRIIDEKKLSTGKLLVRNVKPGTK